MKKIGVLTYIREYANHGTNMQSYSTFKAIEKMYPDHIVEIIYYSGWKPSLKPYLFNVSVRSLIYDFIRIKKYRKFFNQELNFSRKSLISADLSKQYMLVPIPY